MCSWNKAIMKWLWYNYIYHHQRNWHVFLNQIFPVNTTKQTFTPSSTTIACTIEIKYEMDIPPGNNMRHFQSLMEILQGKNLQHQITQRKRQYHIQRHNHVLRELDVSWKTTRQDSTEPSGDLTSHQTDSQDRLVLCGPF